MNTLDKIVGTFLATAVVVGGSVIIWAIAAHPPNPKMTTNNHRVQSAEIPIRQSTEIPIRDITPLGNRDVIERLRPKKTQCAAAVAKLLKTRFFTKETSSASGISMSVEERAWEALSYDDKIRQALLVYCARMPSNGRLTVLVEGHHNGAVLGSVVDGNWSR